MAFSEGMNFYNALRYNGKTGFMLAYPGEGHGLRGLANRRDLTTRYFAFFDHYLKRGAGPEVDDRRSAVPGEGVESQLV